MTFFSKRGISCSVLLIVCVVSIWSIAPAFAAINRPFEPIVLTGNKFAPDFENIPVNQVMVFAYDGATLTWRIVPSQVDEIEKIKIGDEEKWKYVTRGDEKFDSNDELVFLAKDSGDKAPLEAWVADPSSLKFSKFEVMIIDSVALDTGYVYVFRTENPENKPIAEDYIEYDAQKDRIISTNYEVGHNNEGLMTDLVILNGGSNEDFFDRLKLRLVGDAKLEGLDLISVNATEEHIKKDTELKITPLDGNVRVVRRWNIKFVYPLFGILVELGKGDFTFMFYPHYCDFGSSTLKVPPELNLKYVRYSFDLDPTADGMRLFGENTRSAYPEGVFIDQSPDIGVPRNLTVPGWNWWMQTGTPGTIATLALLPKAGSKQELYYKDDEKGTNDPAEFKTVDTGYDGSWGDTGVKFTGPGLTGEVPLGAELYFLGKQVSVDSAETLRKWAQFPLKTVITSTFFVPVELVTFDANFIEDKISLTWSTASETNNFGFSIERRINGETDWTTIGFVPGTGTTTQLQNYRFNDQIQAAGRYHYRLKQIDSNGTFEYSKIVVLDVSPPRTFELAQNYPNPFNPSTLIGYNVPNSTDRVELIIYDILGRQVRALLDQVAQAGFYRVEWDGKDDRGLNVPSGVYIYSLKSGQTIISRKMLKSQ